MLTSSLDRRSQPLRTSASSDQPVPMLLETTTSVLRDQFEADFVWTCLRLPGEPSVPLSSAGRPPVGYADGPITWEGDRPLFHPELAPAVVAHGTVSFQEAIFDIVLGRPGRPFSPAEGTRFEALRKRAQRALDRASILQCEQALRYQEGLLRRREAAFRRLHAELTARERLLKELAHDLINDLTPLTYAAEELAERQAAPDALRLLLLIDRQCVRMRQRLRSNLAPSIVALVSHDWRSCLSDLAHVWQGAFERDGQTFCLLMPDRPVQVLATEQDLLTLASNLLSNAHKYTPPGGHIEVRLEQTGEWAVLEVSDTGRGMDPAFLQRLFQEGAREGTDVEGSGIGLAHVATLLQRLGGSIEVASNPQVGSTFRLHLPIAPGSRG
ncbi:MAG TPA: HAMP domain-containing sensor histidine kinase [Stenomitos sp.]